MKKLIALLLTAVMAVGLLAACGSTPSSNNDTTAGETKAAQETAAPDNSATTNPNADIQQDESAGSVETQLAGMVKKCAPGEYCGDQLTIAASSGPNSLDPFARGGGYGVALFVFEKLGQADQEGNLKLQLLKSIEQVDDLTYKCEIWDFIYDTDGNHLTAKDVEWSLQAFIDAGNSGGVSKFDHIEVTGEYTFNWVNKEPFGIGEYEKQLGNPSIMAQVAYEGDPDHMASRPVGTGPYKMTEFAEGSYGVYEVNEDYWYNNITDEKWLEENDFVWSYQNFKKIRCDVISDASARAIALENGSVDACTAMNSADVNNYVGDDRFTTIDVPSFPPVAFYFNLNEASICKDVNLRKAICYAIDNAAVAAGLDVPAFEVYGIQPRMYDAPKSWTTGEGRDYYNYNVDKAKECLAQSSYNGEPIVVMFGDAGPRQPAWVLIQAMCSEIGINLELKMVENSVMRSENYNWTSWDILCDVFGGGQYLPNVLKKWWSQDVINELNGMNVCGVEDPELDRLYEDVLNVHDDASIEAWDKYFTDEMCMGYAVLCYNDQTACSSKYIPATCGAQGQLCPGAFSNAE